MGRVTELIDFINRDTIPDELERKSLYSHITIDDKIIRLRKEYRKRLKKERNNEI